jgi:hypothetical protein
LPRSTGAPGLPPSISACPQSRSQPEPGTRRRTNKHKFQVQRIRGLAISILRLDGHANIAAANRHHARDPQRTLKLLQAA